MEDQKALVNRDKLRSYIDQEARHWGRYVKARRELLGFTLAELAALADTSPQTIFKIERGEIICRDELRIALAIALRSEVGDLFPIADHKTLTREVAA